jgi:hypothetical protein
VKYLQSQSQGASAKLGEVFEELYFRRREIELKSGGFSPRRFMAFMVFD